MIVQLAAVSRLAGDLGQVSLTILNGVADVVKIELTKMGVLKLFVTVTVFCGDDPASALSQFVEGGESDSGLKITPEEPPPPPPAPVEELSEKLTVPILDEARIETGPVTIEVKNSVDAFPSLFVLVT